MSGPRSSVLQTNIILTRDEEIAEYDRRERAFLGVTYTDDEITRMSLFRALDMYDEIVSTTTRLNRDLAFVTGVDAAAIATNGVALRLEADEGTPADLEVARAAWKRSGMNAALPRRALEICGLGCMVIEVAPNHDGEPVIVWHDPRTVELSTDETGRCVRAVLSFQYQSAGAVDPSTGSVSAVTQHRYVKVATPDEIIVYRDGKLSAKESGPNRLGIVPFRAIEFGRFGRQTIPLCAFSAYDDAIASMDTVASQIRRIGTTNANPLMVGTGVDVGEGAALQEVGRAIGVPNDGARIEWLTLPMEGLKALLDSAIAVREQVVQTLPEFLFVDAGSAASGLSLSYRATAFVSKITPIREGVYEALEWACSLVLALSHGVPWSQDLEVFEIDGGPALPMDQAAVVGMLVQLLEAELITREDAVRTLQGMGVIPDGVDAADYVAQIVAESTSAADAAEARVMRIRGGAAQVGATPSTAQAEDDPGDEDEPLAPPMPPP